MILYIIIEKYSCRLYLYQGIILYKNDLNPLRTFVQLR